MEGRCSECGKIIIKRVKKYKKDYPDEKEVECPYCGAILGI